MTEKTPTRARGPDPTCPRCHSERLRRETRRIPLVQRGRHCATGGWYICLDCGNCFDGVTDHDDGVLPWWVEKRAAGRVRNIEEVEQ